MSDMVTDFYKKGPEANPRLHSVIFNYIFDPDVVEAKNRVIKASEIEEYLKSGVSEITKKYIAVIECGIREINIVCQKYEHIWLTIEPLLGRNDYVYYIEPCALQPV